MNSEIHVCADFGVGLEGEESNAKPRGKIETDRGRREGHASTFQICELISHEDAPTRAAGEDLREVLPLFRLQGFFAHQAGLSRASDIFQRSRWR